MNTDIYCLLLTKFDVSFKSGFGAIVQSGQFDKLVNCENA